MRTAAPLDTPAGPMQLVTDDAGRLWAAEFRTDPARLAASLARFGIDAVRPAAAPHPGVADAFAAWFGGRLDALDGLDLPPLGSALDRAVWAAVQRIPPGETRSYADIARALGGAASGAGVNARAVGAANARNPRAVAVPCHRVIGADGGLVGYAGGLATKQWLLRHEGWLPAQETLW